MSYTIDIYRGKLNPTKDIIAFFAFVAFFPQLVAGPIERATNLLPQFLSQRKFNTQFAISGLRLALWGFFKKIVIADNVAMYVDLVYASPEEFYGLAIIIGAVLFTFQIYCDFSGYSDIAIGIARLFGFSLMTNFRTPLFSASMREFWTRWHISLSTWFRDYFYIPLGGSKVPLPRWLLNLFLTFLISGLWHGASWDYVIWGGLNGIYLILEILTDKFREQVARLLGLTRFPSIHQAIKVSLTFCLFAFSLLIFRAESTPDIFILIWHLPQQLFSQLTDLAIFKATLSSIFASKAALYHIAASFLILISIDFLIRKEGIDAMLHKIPKPARIMLYYFIIFWIIIFGAISEPQDFVYFQF